MPSQCAPPGTLVIHIITRPCRSFDGIIEAMLLKVRKVPG
jgi:hypothetical protein